MYLLFITSYHYIHSVRKKSEYVHICFVFSFLYSLIFSSIELEFGFFLNSFLSLFCVSGLNPYIKFYQVRSLQSSQSISSWALLVSLFLIFFLHYFSWPLCQLSFLLDDQYQFTYFLLIFVIIGSCVVFLYFYSLLSPI